MRDRISIVAATGAVLGALGLCCGLPVLLSLGFLGAIAGISLGSWVLIALGLATVAFALWRDTNDVTDRAARRSTRPERADRQLRAERTAPAHAR